MKYLNILLNSKFTVFTVRELKILLGIQNSAKLNNILITLEKNGFIKRLGYGIVALKNYDMLELASKLRNPSYISLEYVLQKNGIIFQNYSSTITLVSNNTFQKKIDGINFEFHKIKNDILTNPLGLDYNGKYFTASKERAICDQIYLYKQFYFDNLNVIDFEKLLEIATIYPKTTNLLIKKMIKNAESK